MDIMDDNDLLFKGGNLKFDFCMITLQSFQFCFKILQADAPQQNIGLDHLSNNDLNFKVLIIYQLSPHVKLCGIMHFNQIFWENH